MGGVGGYIMRQRHVMIVGAGASGLAAACAAASAGARVTILEKNHVPVRKILSTGSGKCNLTNAHITSARYHGGTAGFIGKVFAACPPPRIRAFFEDIGVLTVQDAEGRVFPRSMKAADVANALVNLAAAKKAETRVLTEVSAVKRTNNGFEISARRVRPRWDKDRGTGPQISLACDSLILAAGGPAYPQIGGSDSGYGLARSLGHEVTAPRPVLVPLKVEQAFVKQAAGVRVQAAVELLAGGKVLACSRGETLFTEYGLSGPAPLELSRAAVLSLESGPAACRLDLFPEYSADRLEALLARRRAAMNGRLWREFICGLADERVLLLLSDLAGIYPGKLMDSVPERTFSGFSALLKSFELELSGTLGFGDAMATSGGVKTRDISPETFGSKKTKDLYVAGELLDVDGDSGGYNLHFAWTSGLLAGRAAAGSPAP